MPDTTEGMDPTMAAIVNRIIAESGGKVTISSGHRTTEEQQRLYDLYKSGQGNLAAKPGTSRHEHGTAVDFGGDLELAGRLARKYGLSMSVPGEPWHFTLGGEEGGHTTRHSEYDLGDDTFSKPADVLANRLQSVLKIMGGGDQVSSPSYEDAEMDAMFQPGDVDGMEVATQLADPAQVTAGDNTPKTAFQKYAAEKLSAQGFGPEEIGALITLWNKESGWNPNADNPTSTAYGIAQFLDGTWAGTGYKRTSDPFKQIDAGLTYIANRYGSPSKALQFHQQNNWY